MQRGGNKSAPAAVEGVMGRSRPLVDSMRRLGADHVVVRRPQQRCHRVGNTLITNNNNNQFVSLKVECVRYDLFNWRMYKGIQYDGTANNVKPAVCPKSGVAVRELGPDVFMADSEFVSALGDIIGLMSDGNHVMFEVFDHPPFNITGFNCVHSTTLGKNNGYHAVCSGGIRRHDLTDSELHVIKDGLDLARNMSYKNVAAQIPFGGCKLAVHSDVVPLNDLSKLGFLAYFIDQSKCFTGPDMGFLPEHADKLRKFTHNIVGGIRGTMGPTGTHAAFGTFLALQQACLARFKTPLSGKKIAIQGLGAAGFPLCCHVIKAGGVVTVSDLDQSRFNLLKKRFPKVPIKTCPPKDFLLCDVDILVPCAVGGIITRAIIPKIKAKVIIGTANNQLDATSVEQELKLAQMLHDRGILFQIEWMHNTAGVIAGWEEYINQTNAKPANIVPLIVKVCEQGTKENLRKAKQKGITPTQNAYNVCEAAIFALPSKL